MQEQVCRTLSARSVCLFVEGAPILMLCEHDKPKANQDARLVLLSQCLADTQAAIYPEDQSIYNVNPHLPITASLVISLLSRQLFAAAGAFDAPILPNRAIRRPHIAIARHFAPLSIVNPLLDIFAALRDPTPRPLARRARPPERLPQLLEHLALGVHRPDDIEMLVLGDHLAEHHPRVRLTAPLEPAQELLPVHQVVAAAHPKRHWRALRVVPCR